MPIPRTEDLRVRDYLPLMPPKELKQKLPLSAKAQQTVIEGRETIQRIINKEDKRTLIIVGPCSIHDEKAALEYAEQGIRVNGIAPGMTRTEMTEGMFGNPNLENAVLREIPLGRMGTAEDIARAAVFLADPDCFMTGETLSITGGAELANLLHEDQPRLHVRGPRERSQGASPDRAARRAAALRQVLPVHQVLHQVMPALILAFHQLLEAHGARALDQYQHTGPRHLPEPSVQGVQIGEGFRPGAEGVCRLLRQFAQREQTLHAVALRLLALGNSQNGILFRLRRRSGWWRLRKAHYRSSRGS